MNGLNSTEFSCPIYEKETGNQNWKTEATLGQQNDSLHLDLSQENEFPARKVFIHASSLFKDHNLISITKVLPITIMQLKKMKNIRVNEIKQGQQF